ncbi:uncharacterized protein SPPG_09005 [Spizellomyces punctatus DAOM BR117]|uniref:F-box domain-containing protein n=2 Tax=Spizellomyces punctatus (strain DAOM BR117) TaxID=645134 RepID=A0A0L0HP54_SPIPD|nr:uncharacterized protein SPPG_09005 [Spizellomyces punctatus DAOM BR117]KND03186.1 hypothetical protein SPPG_09005 [Spizellomyces punctatus DAOM BR117]|eukprot:XP_016611225.1 hypothetical protein SPPG_09005 [Spizellomyces punctatus DAOM BR117]
MSKSTIPTELLNAVFHWVKELRDLYACCLVSRSWFSSAHTYLWGNLEWYTDEWEDFRNVLSRPRHLAADYRHSIQKLVITTSSPPEAGEPRLMGLRKLLHNCPRLTVLNLDCPALNDDDMWTLSTSCRQLRALSLVSGSHPSGCVTDEGIQAIASNCRNLCHLRLRATCAGAFTERAFRAIAERYTDQLQSFALEWVGTHSTGLSVYGGGPDAERRFVEALQAVILQNAKLHALSLDWPIGIDKSLDAAAQTLRYLRSLRIGNAHNTLAIKLLIAANPSLESLSLYEVNLAPEPSRFFAPLLSNLRNPRGPTIRELELEGIGCVANILPFLTRFHSLTRVKFAQSRRAAFLHLPAIDDFVAAVARSCPHLQSIDIPIMTDVPILQIAHGCPMLEELDVGYGKEVTDSAIIFLARKCPKIHKLHLGCAELLTDTSLTILMESLGPSLRRLTLPFGNKLLTIKTLRAIANHCKRLEGLANLPATMGMRPLLENVPKLTRLLVLGLSIGPHVDSVQGWRHYMSREEQDTLKAACKRLKYISYGG